MTEHLQVSDSLIEIMHIKHGPLMTGTALWKALGFQNSTAFSQAKAKNRLEVKVFSLRNRRGSFAFTEDVANWLVQLKTEANTTKS